MQTGLPVHLLKEEVHLEHAAALGGSPGTRKPKVLVVLKEYPQVSQTYIKTEIEALENDYDLTIVTRRGPDVPYKNHRPYRQVERMEEIREIAEDVKPDILHTHYLVELPYIGQLAEATGVPFTVRAHSFDTIALRRKSLRGRARQYATWLRWGAPPLEKTEKFRQGLRAMEGDYCLGVLSFPCTRPWLEAAGVPGNKLVDCFPSVAVDRFFDRSPNGEGVMNTGVATPKKRMGDFLKLGTQVPERTFRLYAMGYHLQELIEQNKRMGSPVEFVDAMEPDDMPAEYKKHQWLVYTGDFNIPTVGWPMAVAEAQAAGVGVCMPRLRPDLAQYVGDGGVLYDTIDDVAEIVRQPVPEEMREAGFAQARRSDIKHHKYLLTDLWDRVVHTTSREREPVRSSA